MEENKKKIIAIVFLLLAIIAVITFIISLFIKNDNPNNNSDGNNSNSVTLSKEFVRLDNANKYFGVQKAINDFYVLISNNKTGDLINVLDSNYIEERNINSQNIYSFLNPSYSSTSYIAKNIYYNTNSSVTYYFVSGYLIDVALDDSYNFYDDVNYLIIVDESSNNYVISPLANNISILEYANNYDVDDRDINNNFSLISTNISEKNKLSTYINEFLNLLIYNPQNAYSLLNDDTKNNYVNVESFKNEVYNIYSKFSSKIFSYTKKEEDNKIIYYVKDDNQNNIIIEEYGIMDFKLSY